MINKISNKLHFFNNIFYVFSGLVTMESSNNTSSLCNWASYRRHETIFESTFKLLAYSVAFLIAIFANILIIKIVFRKSTFRTTTNFFIANMAVSDVALALLCMPSTMYTIATKNFAQSAFRGVAGVLVCKLMSFLQGLFIGVSILTVLVLAVDRFLAIVYPFQKIICKRRAKLLILALYVVAAIFNAPLLYAMTYFELNDVHYCIENWEPYFDNLTAPRTYTIVLFIFLYACPLLMVVFFYGAVIRELWRGKLHHNSTVAFRENKSVLKMVLTVTIVFAVCWLPVHVTMFIHMFPPNRYIMECGMDQVIIFIGWFMGHLNSAINPLIYFIHAESFRLEAKKTMRPFLRVFLRGHQSALMSRFFRHRGRESSTRSSSVYYSINRTVLTEQSAA